MKKIFVFIFTVSLVFPQMFATAELPADFPTSGISETMWVDVNRDGDSELFVIGRGGTQNRLYRFEGGEWYDIAGQIGLTIDGFSGHSAAWCDFNNDYLLDVLIIGMGTNDSYIFSQDEYGYFERILAQGFPRNESVKFMDANNDGTLDWFSTSGDLVITGSGESQYLMQNESFTWIDYNYDGAMDLVLCPSDTASNNLTFYKNNGGIFNRDFPMDNPPYGCQMTMWEDCNSDGYVDLVVFTATNIEYYHNNHGNGFVEPSQLPVQFGVKSAIWSDLNCDGYFDIFVWGCVEDQQDAHKIFMNTGTGGFYPASETGIDFYGEASKISIADYNNDNQPDILIVGEQSSALYKNIVNTPPFSTLKLYPWNSETNSFAYGARVTVGNGRAGRGDQIGGGGGDQKSQKGDDDGFDFIERQEYVDVSIFWPSGTITNLDSAPVIDAPPTEDAPLDDDIPPTIDAFGPNYSNVSGDSLRPNMVELVLELTDVSGLSMDDCYLVTLTDGAQDFVLTTCFLSGSGIFGYPIVNHGQWHVFVDTQNDFPGVNPNDLTIASIEVWDNAGNVNQSDCEDLQMTTDIDCESSPVAQLILGDVNFDQSVNIQDVILTVNFALGIASPTENQRIAADMNGDDAINIQDVILVVNKALGITI